MKFRRFHYLTEEYQEWVKNEEYQEEYEDEFRTACEAYKPWVDISKS